MIKLIEEELPGIHDLRDQMMAMLTDQDLAYQLPGHNPTLGELCVEMGHYQQIYTHSFQAFEMDWQYPTSRPEATNSVASLDAWFKQLDADLFAALNALTEPDVRRQIDRGHGFNVNPVIQFKIYHEALLMFYAKASVYLKALEKPRTNQWKSWIG